MVLGSVSESPELTGAVIDLQPGDVLVVPSGVAHVTLKASDDFTYVGVYPKGAPHWRNEFGKKPVTDAQIQRELAEVAMPVADPVQGNAGALVRIWNQVRGASKL
jgi:uncharacterized protein YjlB